ncbi:MAG: hypothetical protein BRC38_01915 [Cyanobacteria bacterium QH_6_48_35]|nr:MAG: hypothetical protein BRC38_01915 [Cyanobacteria bacterium QH_6_48_35]
MWCRSARDVEMGRRGDKDTGREFLRAARYLRSGEWKVRIDTPQPKGVGILASTGESRKHGTKSRYFPRSQNHDFWVKEVRD